MGDWSKHYNELTETLIAKLQDQDEHVGQLIPEFGIRVVHLLDPTTGETYWEYKIDDGTKAGELSNVRVMQLVGILEMTKMALWDEAMYLDDED